MPAFACLTPEGGGSSFKIKKGKTLRGTDDAHNVFELCTQFCWDPFRVLFFPKGSQQTKRLCTHSTVLRDDDDITCRW